MALPEDSQFHFPSPDNTLEDGLQKQPAHTNQCNTLPAVSSPNSCWAQRASAAQLAPIGICNVSHLSDKDLGYLTSRGVFDLPPKPVQDELVKTYFLHVHPFLPFLNEGDFWSDYDHGLKSTSFLVYRAILFAVCPVRLSLTTTTPLTFTLLIYSQVRATTRPAGPGPVLFPWRGPAIIFRACPREWSPDTLEILLVPLINLLTSYSLTLRLKQTSSLLCKRLCCFPIDPHGSQLGRRGEIVTG